MKNKKIIPIMVVLILICLVFAGCDQDSLPVLAEADATESIATSSTSIDTTQNSVSVIGTATISVTPDIAIIGLSVISEGDTATAASTANQTDAEKVTKELIAQGIKEADIQTSGFNVYPEYTYDDEGKRTLDGYSAQTNFTVTINKIGDVGKIIDQAIKAGANGAYGISYQASTASTKYNEALKSAYTSAKSKADTLTAAVGKKTGNIIKIIENRETYAILQEDMTQAVADTESAAKIQPGKIDIKAEASFIFEMK